MSSSDDSARPETIQIKRSDWVHATGVSLAIALAIVAPFFWLGTASGHDIQFHAGSWVDAANQWKQGILYPRWAEFANFGFGEPRFIFYPPLSWMLGAALGMLLPWSAVPGALIVISQTIAGITAYGLARRAVPQGWSLLAAACMAGNPNALLIAYQRSDFAELFASAFFPLLLLVALDLVSSAGSSTARLPARVVRFAAVFAVIWLSNAPAGVIATYACAALFGWEMIQQRSWKTAARGVAGFALGFGLAGFYLVPAAYEQRWVNIGDVLSGGLLPGDNFLFTTIQDADHNAFNRMASWIAVVMIVWTIAALAVSWWKSNNKNKSGHQLRIAILIVAGTATLLMTKLTNSLWMLLPKLKFVQFPWRWMSILAVAFAVFSAGAASKRLSRVVWGILVAILLTGTAAYLAKHAWWDTEDVPVIRNAVLSGEGYEGVDEYDPQGDEHENLPHKQERVAIWEEHAGKNRDKAAAKILEWGAEDRVVQVQSDARTKIRLRLLHYPAWRVTVNGKKIVPEGTQDYEAMVVPLEPGISTIEAKFERTPDRTAGGAISILAVLVSAMLWINGRKVSPMPSN